jgi:protein-L-isoaspartate O-methyltransferase
VLFGRLVAQVTVSRGNDVGRFYGMNTLGSCLGILGITLVGFEFHPAAVPLALGGGYLALLVYYRCSAISEPLSPTAGRILWAGVILCMTILTGHAVQVWNSQRDITRSRGYYGREGVIEVKNERDMIWNGLWHSKLSYQSDHIGSNNWLTAAVPLLCHSGTQAKEALVIGLGTGITAAVLASSSQVQSVDAYEINPEVRKVLQDYPDGTLRVVSHSKVNLIWQDARIGLALNRKKYDLITQAPLYLSQAGSSILLSIEYMQLIKKRLKKKGIFCIYCNSFGNQEQALVVRKTADEVFSYGESFGGGYMLIVSDDPFEFMAPSITALFTQPEDTNRINHEIQTFGVNKLRGYLDVPRLNWDECPVFITDNHPIVEYPHVAREIVRNHQQKSTQRKK